MLFSRIWIRLTFIAAWLQSVCGIDCYVCTSLSGQTKECEDKFQRDLTTAQFIKRRCYFGFFKANYCIKLKGKRSDGTSIVVRQCADENWNRHCGGIKYEFGGVIETIQGCLETCDFDGCNSSSVVSYYFLILGLPSVVLHLCRSITLCA